MGTKASVKKRTIKGKLSIFSLFLEIPGPMMIWYLFVAIFKVGKALFSLLASLNKGRRGAHE
jgi:hypothetical protein